MKEESYKQSRKAKAIRGMMANISAALAKLKPIFETLCH
jgi:hypothetical protein